MYSSHSKDINRNKSFHPLTFSNLRKVEKLKENAEEKTKVKNVREEELRRDQELRRYDDLLLNTTSMTTSTAQVNSDRQASTALYNQVKSIFAAEYNTKDIYNERTEKKQREEFLAHEISELQESEPSSRVKTAVKTELLSKGLPPINNEQSKNVVQHNYLSKFHKVDCHESFVNESDNLLESDKTEELRSKKRNREEYKEENATENLNTRNQPSDLAEIVDKNQTETITGHISTAETVNLKKELDMIKKERLDPLRKVHQFNNKTIATEARAQERKNNLEEGKQNIHENNSIDGLEQSASHHRHVKSEENETSIHAYVTQLLAIKRKRK